MSAEAIDLLSPRRAADLSPHFSARGYINPFSILEFDSVREGRDREQHSFDQIQEILVRAFGHRLPGELWTSGILTGDRFVLIDHPSSMTSIWLAAPQDTSWLDASKDPSKTFPYQLASGAIVLNRGSYSGIYTPASLSVSGRDKKTQRPIAVKYEPSNTGLTRGLMTAQAVNVGITQNEGKTEDPADYRWTTLPAPTPTHLSWHNMSAAGLITEAMIPKDDTGNPIHKLVIKGDNGAINGISGGEYEVGIVLRFDREPKLEKAKVAVNFTANNGNRWSVAVPYALQKVS